MYEFAKKSLSFFFFQYLPYLNYSSSYIFSSYLGIRLAIACGSGLAYLFDSLCAGSYDPT